MTTSTTPCVFLGTSPTAPREDEYQLPEPAMIYMRGDMETARCYTESQLREAYARGREDMKAECLNCYSPDDTATDWTDKIKDLK